MFDPSWNSAMHQVDEALAVRAPELEPCGFCNGTGRVVGPLYDRDGRRRDDWPKTIVCEYCGGAGQCPEGGKLLPAWGGRPPVRD